MSERQANLQVDVEIDHVFKALYEGADYKVVTKEKAEQGWLYTLKKVEA